MPDLMREKLGAYHDGELVGPARQAMQAHLETCSACRGELAALRQLSEILRRAPLPADLPAARPFANALRLPDRPSQPAAWPASRASWLVPLGLLAALVFIQATSVLTTLAALAPLDGISAWFSSGPGQTLWFSASRLVLQNALRLDVLPSLQAANDLIMVVQQWLIDPFLWQLAAALAYGACLFAWWSGRQAANSQEQILES